MTERGGGKPGAANWMHNGSRHCRLFSALPALPARPWLAPAFVERGQRHAIPCYSSSASFTAGTVFAPPNFNSCRCDQAVLTRKRGRGGTESRVRPARHPYPVHSCRCPRASRADHDPALSVTRRSPRCVTCWWRSEEPAGPGAWPRRSRLSPPRSLTFSSMLFGELVPSRTSRWPTRWPPPCVSSPSRERPSL